MPRSTWRGTPHLGEQGVTVLRHGVSCGDIAVEADAGAAGQLVRLNTADVGLEVLRRVLARHAALHRVACGRWHSGLAVEGALRERHARHTLELELHEVHVRHLLQYTVSVTSPPLRCLTLPALHMCATCMRSCTL